LGYFISSFWAGPPKALDEDETEFLEKLELVRLFFFFLFYLFTCLVDVYAAPSIP
jgi:hypothetical protein